MEKSPTFDEPTHLTAGYSYWLRNDFRLDPENGNLPARWAALPLFLSRPNFPSTENFYWKQDDVGHVSQQFFYGAGNNSDRLLLQGRMMMAALSTALCLLIFFCSKRLFGTTGGLISESIAVFDPNLLAHGALITADVPAAFFLTAAIWSYWQLLHRVTVRWFALSALGAAGLFLAKMSGVLFLFMGSILGAIHIFSRGPIAIQVAGFEKSVVERWRKAAVVIGSASAIGAVIVLTIWAAFSFRFFAFTEVDRARELWNARWDYLLADQTPAEKIMAFARTHRLLPEAYLYGLAHVHEHLIDRPAFLDGQWSNVGFPSFFLRAFCYKTPLPVLFLMAMGVLAGGLRWSRPAAPACRRKIVQSDLIQFSPIWVLALVYSAFALTSRLNIGHRHLLPIYPAIFIACGACCYFFRSKQTRLMGSLVVAIIFWQAIESFAIRPDYLAYFNQVAGGPANGYKHLVDSSLDWGQDLPPLKTWLYGHKSELAEGRLYLAYFGTGDPSWYGINAIMLRDDGGNETPSPLEPGTYCISATTLQQLYVVKQGKWAQPYEAAYQLALTSMQQYEKLSPQNRSGLFKEFQRLRFGRLCAYLRHREPIAQVGHSILIFHLTEDDLHVALYSPPAELAPSIEVRTE